MQANVLKWSNLGVMKDVSGLIVKSILRDLNLLKRVSQITLGMSSSVHF